MRNTLLGLLALMALLLSLASCTPPRDSYELTLVFTSDCKGYLEDCG